MVWSISGRSATRDSHDSCHPGTLLATSLSSCVAGHAMVENGPAKGCKPFAQLVLEVMLAIPPARPRRLARVAAISASVLCVVPLAWAATAFGGDREGPRAELVNLPARSVVPSTTIDSLAGHSRALRVAFLTREDVDQLPSLIKRFGSDVRLPGVRTLSLPQNFNFSFVTLKPWVEKKGNYVNTYHVGRWPGERRNMPDNYDN